MLNYFSKYMGEKIQENFPESDEVQEEKESALKEQLMAELASAQTIDDLANIKAKSLNLDERTGYRTDVRKSIIKRFEEILTEKTKELI